MSLRSWGETVTNTRENYWPDYYCSSCNEGDGMPDGLFPYVVGWQTSPPLGNIPIAVIRCSCGELGWFHLGFSSADALAWKIPNWPKDQVKSTM